MCYINTFHCNSSSQVVLRMILREVTLWHMQIAVCNKVILCIIWYVCFRIWVSILHLYDCFSGCFEFHWHFLIIFWFIFRIMLDFQSSSRYFEISLLFQCILCFKMHLSTNRLDRRKMTFEVDAPLNRNKQTNEQAWSIRLFLLPYIPTAVPCSADICLLLWLVLPSYSFVVFRLVRTGSVMVAIIVTAKLVLVLAKLIKTARMWQC